MADFVNGFWNAYVMVLVALSIAFCVFITPIRPLVMVALMYSGEPSPPSQSLSVRLGKPFAPRASAP